jgi:hypothetical protein
MLPLASDFWVFFPFDTLTDVALGLSVEDVGETGVASGEKTYILDSLSMEGALELSRVVELSLSFEDFLDAGGGISVTFFRGEPEKGKADETITKTEIYGHPPEVFAFFSFFGVA